MTMLNAVPSQAYDLVKHFEGLRLESYRCPAGVWTCGYGTTGAFIKSGMRITQQQAEVYLQEALIAIANNIPDAIWTKLQSHQRAALISFLYNVGMGALNAPSFGKAIRENLGEVPTRLLDWDKAIVDGTKTSLIGLTRRRRAEAILWVKGTVITDEAILDNWGKVQDLLRVSNQSFQVPSSSVVSAPAIATVSLTNAAKYYKGEPHQVKAFEWLDAQITENQRSQFGSMYRALPASDVKASLPQASKPNPWFIFDQPLGDKPVANIVVGTLTLKGFPNHDSTTEWDCTSGQPRYQYSGGTDMKGKGPLPGHRYVKDKSGNPIKHYWVTTSPSNLRHVKGVEGNAYWITPDPVLINGVWRGEFMVHRDSNRLYSPGSAGCIVTITDDIFKEIEAMLKKLRDAGFKQIPLEVNH